MNEDRSFIYSERTARLLPVAFLIIIVGFVLGNLLALLSARRTQDANRRISENAIVSIEDISLIIHDIDLVRLLVDAHIFEKTNQQMDPIERRIVQTETNLSDTVQQFEPLTTFSEEHELWENLWGRIRLLRRPIQDALRLSRDNRDVEAREAMKTIETHFDTINKQAEILFRINQNEAQTAVAEIRALQRRSQMALVGITAGGTLLGLIVTVWVTQVLRRRDRKIAHATSLLEAKNQELDAFSGRVAHDLRGPLTTINLSTLRLSAHTPEEDSALASLRRGVNRMDALIRDLLTLSRVDIELSKAVTNTELIAKVIAEDLTPNVNSVSGVIRIEVPPAQVRCSDVLLRQVLWNLGENSIKYRRPDVRLEVGIYGRTVDDFYEFRISDNGTGMSAEDTPHIFDPFFRASKVPSIPGTGLGLSIVNRVIQASGGSISVTSEPEKGTTFLFTLPLVRNENAAVTDRRVS